MTRKIKKEAEPGEGQASKWCARIRKSTGFDDRQILVQILVLPLISYVKSDRLVNLSESHFSQSKWKN